LIIASALSKKHRKIANRLQQNTYVDGREYKNEVLMAYVLEPTQTNFSHLILIFLQAKKFSTKMVIYLKYTGILRSEVTYLS